MSVALAKVESWEEHIEAWHHLGREADGAVWARAGLALSVRTQYREAGLESFAETVGFGRSTMYAYARTFEFFPEPSVRMDAMPFYAHLITAELSKTGDEARGTISLAASKRWSIRGIRAHLNPPQPKEERGATGPTCDAESGACGPVTGPDRLLHTLVILRDLYLVKDYEPDPILNACKKKDLKDLHMKLTAVAEWVQSLQTAINRRLQ